MTPLAAAIRAPVTVNRRAVAAGIPCLTTVQAGVLRSNNPTALGTPGNGTVVVNGAALEISANLKLPLSVVKILIGDLVEQGLVHFRSAVTPDVDILRAVIDGIRQL